MEASCEQDDLTRSRGAWLLWRLPFALILVGAIWSALLYWLWIPAFLVCGAACLWNAARCGRVHCYLTGPLYLGAAAYLGLAANGAVPLHPIWFLVVVLGLGMGAQLLERRVGPYRTAAG